MIWLIFIVMATLFIAYANGANDNFKGVATLFGSGTTDYRKALTWATITTFLGSLTALYLAQRLIKTFSGKGLVPDALISNPAFLVSVILGAGITVFLASNFGIPISTTHSLTGALAGSGFAAIGMELAFGVLGKKFFLPLIISPFLAITFTMVVYAAFKYVRGRLRVSKKTCVCIGEKVVPIGELGFIHGQVIPIMELRKLDIFVDEEEGCQAKAVEIYSGKVWGFEIQRILDGAHFLSAGAVCFARGLNDTPKIVALCVATGMVGMQWHVGFVAVAMAIGGILGARRVAQTMSHRITKMNHGQGFTANLMTSVIVIGASCLGSPVSTTHVSCGSLFGIGLTGGHANWKVISGIAGAWVLTLPVAAILSAGSYFMLSGIGG